MGSAVASTPPYMGSTADHQMTALILSALDKSNERYQ